MRVHRIINFVAASLSLAAVARAQTTPGAPRQAPADATPARHYVQGSVSLVSQGELLTTLPSSMFAPNLAFGGFGLGATLRIIVRHIVVQPHLGFFLSPIGVSSPLLDTNVSPGLSVGGAIELGPRVALTPMLRSEIEIGPVVIFAVLAHELPVTVFIARGAFVEPFVDLGVEVFALTGLAQRQPFVGGGVRLGASF